MNKFHLTLSIIAVVMLTSTMPVSAQTASPSGTIRDSVKQKVAAELAQIKKAVAKKGFVGSVTTKTDATITMTTLLNQTRNLVVTTDTTVKLSGSKDGTLADIKVGDYILAMGDVDSDNKMNVKRLLVIPQPPADKRVATFGTVTKSTSSSITLTNLKNESYDIKVTAGTKFNDKFKFSDLKDGSKVVVLESTSTTAGKTTHTALNIFIIQ